MENKVKGNISTISQTTLAELEALYEEIVPRSEIISQPLAQAMARLTDKIGKEIAVYITRLGKVELVTVGSGDLAHIPELNHRRAENGLCGLRCIHTHPNGDSRLSSPDMSALVNLRLDMMAALGTGEKLSLSFALLRPDEAGYLNHTVTLYGPFNEAQFYRIQPLELIQAVEKALFGSTYAAEDAEERAVLVTVLSSQTEAWEEDEIQSELRELAKTAGLQVVGELTQKKDKPDAALYLGRGKLEELSLLCQNSRADCVVFEKPLSPSQNSNLTQALGLKVLDKTTLILDIFAQRARSKEGKLQVELAQLNYLLPRLTGRGTEMSRLGGGVGTRGPGETKLENDKRHIRRRIDAIERELEAVRRHREVQGRSKTKNGLFTAALVGYTNAGKSSLLNALVGDNIYAEDQLFATLDTTTRALLLPDKSKVLITDTVGFIRDLPHQLIEAFKATLEELQSADLLLHVVDISSQNYENQIRAVHQVLEELGVTEKDMIYVFNKMDRLEELPVLTMHLPKENCCYVSALTGYHLPELLELINSRLNRGRRSIQLSVPIARGDLLNKAYAAGRVEDVAYTESTIDFRLTCAEKDMAAELEEYIVWE